MPPQQREIPFTKSDESQQDQRIEAPILAATRHHVKANGSIVGRDVYQTIMPLYQTFASAIPTELSLSSPALASIDGRLPITHSRIHDFVVNEYGPALHALGFGRGHRIALILPNGPELALAIIATAHWASCVPLSANGASSELEADLRRCGADLVIGPYSGDVAAERIRPDERFHVLDDKQDWKYFASVEESAKKLNIPFVGLVPSPYEAGVFRLVPRKATSPLRFDDQSITVQPLRQGQVDKECNHSTDEVLVLFTSGTTGDKKSVNHQLGDMLTAATTIALSWNLTPSDVNCNLMPLFHVGGIVRQVFSPLISGGSVICCPSFDPSIFWSLLSKEAFTWYYAAPTMHQLILQTHESDVCPAPRLRMVANAAGGLLPSLATQLRDTFAANILPSYGMTEVCNGEDYACCYSCKHL